MLKSFKIYTCTNGSLGLHLSRAPWDPYPWVSSIQKDSNSYMAGLRVGDCLLELNGNDVLGLKISEIAALLKNHWLNESSNHVSVVIWRKKAKDNSDTEDDDEDEENNAHNINQQSLQKFATCLQHIAQLLECPVCLEVVKPPGWQCCNGHVLCNNCRSRSEKCPVCRVPLGPRGRCLLSDKLFTLLADSFPCDGVRNNKNSPKDRRKCTTEFHNQPKLAIESKQKQQQQCQDEDEVKAKDIKKTEHDSILSSLRMGRRRRTKTKKEETENNDAEEEGQQENKRPHHSMALQQALYEATNAAAVVNVSVNTDASNNGNNINRKSSQDYRDGVTTTTAATTVTSMTVQVPVRSIVEKNKTFASNVQDDVPAEAAANCHCRECYKPDNVALVNNVPTTRTTTTTMPNKYILRVYEEAILHQQHHQRQYYQCPTGKLCCLQQNVMPTSVAPAADATEIVASAQRRQQQMTNSNLSTKQTTATTTTKILHNEWQLLTHLTQDHQLAVNQYYAEFGQRITIRHDAPQQSIICLNLRSTESTAQMEKFFVAFVPMSDNAARVLATSNRNHHSSSLENSNSLNTTTSTTTTTTTSTKVAIFVWHMNPLQQLEGNDQLSGQEFSKQSHDGGDDEVSNFDAIIENPKTGIKWFGRAHCLTTPWSHIYHKQHFLMHEVIEGQHGATVQGGSAVGDSFVIVIKSKS
ncbi:uncharacterized protein [Musca autumnalis]|uniref:uncharacterized protein n=1 Tax=Musca autumnalis TaxID=221902 RepID=UPI003CED47AA